MIVPSDYVRDAYHDYVLAEAIRVFGVESQLKMMIEEMSELTKAICKLWRTKPGTEAVFEAEHDVLEEMADVQIMLNQMKMMFGDTDEIEHKKIERLRSRIEQKEAKDEDRNDN